MIGRLVGRVVAQDDDVCTIDVAGVGYDVTVPAGAVAKAEREPEERVVIHVHTVVREDAFQLFGFASQMDRAVFRAMLAVSGIGPKTAVGILSALPAASLRDAVEGKDLTRLTDVPGIGKKTAERLVLELAGKLGMVPGSPAVKAGAPPPATASAQVRERTKALEGTLTSLGFKPPVVERAVEGVRARIATDLPLADLVREALAFTNR